MNKRYYKKGTREGALEFALSVHFNTENREARRAYAIALAKAFPEYAYSENAKSWFGQGWVDRVYQTIIDREQDPYRATFIKNLQMAHRTQRILDSVTSDIRTPITGAPVDAIKFPDPQDKKFEKEFRDSALLLYRSLLCAPEVPDYEKMVKRVANPFSSPFGDLGRAAQNIKANFAPNPYTYR